MKKLIRKILKEDLDYWGVSDASPENDEYHMSPLNEDMDEMDDSRQMFLNRIIEVMKNDYPLIKYMDIYGFTEQLSEEEINYVLSEIFGEPVTLDGQNIYNQNGNRIYSEYSNGFWEKFEYDENGNRIYSEYSDGYWLKIEYDENGREIYRENSKGKIIDNR